MEHPAAGVSSLMDSLDSNEFAGHLSTLRRWFHAHPELAFTEADTAAKICHELDRLGIAYRYSGVGHAVLADIPGESDNLPIIGLRAEMDALPGNESTDAPYASKKPGRMHACGHDAHMTMLLGAARLLSEKRPSGPVRLIFQPAEERGGGARVAISDGALENMKVIFAAHVTHEYATGTIMIRTGEVTSQSDSFKINIRGRGGHGARPHEAIDAVVISGFLIMALQTIVSREVNPLHSSVVTIGKIRAGSAGNVIAEDAELLGSIRTTRPDVREHIHHGLRRMVAAAAELHNATISVEIQQGYPPVVNDPDAALIAREAAADIFGSQYVVDAEFPSMGSEDFSFYLAEVPGAFVRLGARHPDWIPTPLHSPAFDIDEAALVPGARFLDKAVRAAHDSFR